MHKRFAIALQTVRAIAGGASGRGGPGLGNGGKPARRCGDLVFSDGSETGRCQPESLADVPESRQCQPESLADVPEPRQCQPESLADVSESRRCQPESLADVSEPRRCQPESLADVLEPRRCQPESLAEASARGDAKVHNFSPNAADEVRRPGNVKAQDEALGWLHKPYATVHGRDKTVAAIFVMPLHGLALILRPPQGSTSGYRIAHLRRSDAPCRQPSLTPFAARQSAAHSRHAKLG